MIDPVRNCVFRVLPLTLSEAIATPEILAKLTNKLNEIVSTVNDINTDLTTAESNIKTLQTQVEDLYTELNNIKNGKYMDVYIEALSKWIDANLQEIVAKIAKQVFFGLTPDGYFVAYIPESWSDISFDTIMSCGDPYWGRLVLKY